MHLRAARQGLPRRAGLGGVKPGIRAQRHDPGVVKQEEIQHGGKELLILCALAQIIQIGAGCAHEDGKQLVIRRQPPQRGQRNRYRTLT